MILEWLVTSIYELPSVKDKKQGAARDKAAGVAIMTGVDGLKGPVVRPTEEVRREFRSQLASNFSLMLDVVTGEQADIDALKAKLPPELAGAVSELRKDPETIKALRVISGHNLGPRCARVSSRRPRARLRTSCVRFCTPPRHSTNGN